VKSVLAERFRLRLRYLRKEFGLTQEQLAERAGIDYKFYQSVEAGRQQNVGLFTLEKIAKALQMEACDLIAPDFRAGRK
jgi:transcriptional regulator with XRE-family HTH domain